uniref:autotransporter outer membrane beta-barrel domain-containing protein n=1 Tax=Castellaniella defragrans TaxID=75697 RepID=UPI0033428B38
MPASRVDHIHSARCWPFALLLMAALAGQPLFAQTVGEAIIWSDDEQSKGLQIDPMWGEDTALFPDGLTNNSVTVSGGPEIGIIYGGVALGNDNVSGNKVYFSGSGRVNVYIVGGESRGGDSTGNQVTISGGSVDVSVWGGWSWYGNATENQVTISDGTVGGAALGGESWYGNATENQITMSGGTVGWDVYGGWSGGDGNATNNKVAISGGTVNWNVFGGRSSGEGDATGNAVTISGGSVSLHVNGGYSEYGNATGNIVDISGTPQFSAFDTSLYGGDSDDADSAGDLFTGNILNFSAHPIAVNEVANFQYYKFTLDPSLANDMDTALITASTVVLGDRNGTPSEVEVIGIHSGDVLSAGDQFLLVEATEAMSGNGTGGVQKEIAQQGISLLYDVETKVDVEGKRITAEILSAYEPGINPQLKSLSEGRLATLMLATRGADAVAYDLYHAIQTENPGGLVPFILAAGGHSRYDSGSHINSDDFLLTGGLSYRRAGLTAVIFAESGWGNYDTHNSFAHAASVRGDGDTRYYGGGLFGRYDFASGPYVEASVRLGNTRTSFDTGDLVNAASGESAHYNLNSRYTSAHIGVGYPWVFDDNNLLDVSLKYLWTHIEGKDATVAGDPLHFDSLQSQRLRLSGEWRHRHSDSLTLLAGLGYEHEFDARADGTAYGYAIEAPSLKGSTGILSLGATITPTSNRRLSVDLRGQGYVGKREGVGGLVRVNYAF